MQTIDNPAQSTIKQAPVAKQVPIDFGNGRYSPLMSESFKDAKVIFGMNDKSAEKLARQIGSDFGAAMQDTIAASKIGKALSKDGKVTLSEASKAKVTVTNALYLMRAMSFCNDAGKYGFSFSKTSWKPTEETQKVLDLFIVD